ncbi:hypothetical protein B0H11DRAFT_2243541 [Mycena galericulata]|nr:hypothetical protein B0H11DRAFT_2243541 [Mycena galericulata]
MGDGLRERGLQRRRKRPAFDLCISSFNISHILSGPSLCLYARDGVVIRSAAPSCEYSPMWKAKTSAPEDAYGLSSVYTVHTLFGVQGLQAGSAGASQGQQYWCWWRRRGWGQRGVVHGRRIGMRGLTLSKSCPELKELYSSVGYEPLDRESELFKFSDLASFSLSVRHGLRDLRNPPLPHARAPPAAILDRAPYALLHPHLLSASARLFDLSPLPVARFPVTTSLTLGTFGRVSASFSPHTLTSDEVPGALDTDTLPPHHDATQRAHEPAPASKLAAFSGEEQCEQRDVVLSTPRLAVCLGRCRKLVLEPLCERAL